MTRHSEIFLFLVLGLCNALTVPRQLHMATSQANSLQMQHNHFNDASMEDMKEEIARLRQEALRRLDILNEQMHHAEHTWHSDATNANDEAVAVPATALTQERNHMTAPPQFVSAMSLDHVEDAASFKESEHADALYRARLERDALHFMEQVEPTERITTATVAAAAATSERQSSLRLLDNTRWRLMLNVGREKGTWMPKDWGVSGDRLRIHLELDFSSDQLYEREEFLNGFSGAKVLKVLHNSGQVAPSLNEGGKKVRITEGGWRVAPGEGPMGTDVLRFYFDLEQEAKHAGSDVYCPAGRIYCTCGYFPMKERYRHEKESEKDILQAEMNELESEYKALTVENDMDNDLVSWNKFQRSRRLMDLRSQATKLNHRMHEAQIKEPDKSLLRMSKDQSVGLTREGGICCKVHKGLAIEYHILGKFEIGALSSRDHSDYRDLLP